TLEDYNFALNRVRQTFTPKEGDEQTIYDYWQLTSSRMIFGAAASEAISDEFEGNALPIFTYLATAIGKGEVPDQYQEPAVPYSTVTALDFSALAAPLLDQEGNPIQQIGPDEVVLNAWTAEQLEAQLGDTIYLKYFEPESAHGVSKET